ncbi:hypothetical protein [Streptomyces synnematoformans]|uniref:hypothetical protein n=1 Tax=Streptomyces synnematoformans TaxID=415721 RepID=UPI0031D96B37
MRYATSRVRRGRSRQTVRIAAAGLAAVLLAACVDVLSDDASDDPRTSASPAGAGEVPLEVVERHKQTMALVPIRIRGGRPLPVRPRHRSLVQHHR